MLPTVESSEAAGNKGAVDTHVGEKGKENCHEYRPWFCLTIDVSGKEAEQRIKNVAAGNNRVLVGEVKGERENGSQVEREWREAEKDVDSGGGDDSGDPAEDEIADVKVSGNPKDEIPERRMAFISKTVHQELRKAEIAG